MRRMKTIFGALFATGLIGMFACSAWAGMGMGHGTGGFSRITEGAYVAVEGIVSALGTPGEGIQIDTGEDVVTVFGFGPVSYWNDAGIARPTLGEAIYVEGHEIIFSDGTGKIIAFSVTVEGELLALRDPETGMPLWRGLSKKMGGDFAPGEKGERRRDGSCGSE